ncbi:MAG: hypothetical protein ACYSWP_20210 [Planctomycetota bacterium]|jgi:hypothetical protein
MGNANKMNTDENSNHPEQQTKSANQTISKKTVAIAYFGSLLFALLITWSFYGFDGIVIPFAWMFPLGLLSVFPDYDIHAFYAYAIYTVMFICAFKFRREVFFLILLIVYFIILSLNIVGCPKYVNSNPIDFNIP